MYSLSGLKQGVRHALQDVKLGTADLGVVSGYGRHKRTTFLTEDQLRGRLGKDSSYVHGYMLVVRRWQATTERRPAVTTTPSVRAQEDAECADLIAQLRALRSESLEHCECGATSCAVG